MWREVVYISDISINVKERDDTRTSRHSFSSFIHPPWKKKIQASDRHHPPPPSSSTQNKQQKTVPVPLRRIPQPRLTKGAAHPPFHLAGDAAAEQAVAQGLVDHAHAPIYSEGGEGEEGMGR